MVKLDGTGIVVRGCVGEGVGVVAGVGGDYGVRGVGGVAV